MALMERMYRALEWLAVVALVLGLVIAFLFLTTAINRYPQGLTFGSSDGLVGAFFKALSFQTANMAMSLSSLLGDGAFVLAAALAWVQRRRAWLTALIVAVLLTLAWPSFTIAWVNLSFGPAGIPGSQIETFDFIVLSVPLIPVALALAFALTRHKPASAATTDAEMGIVRSAL